MTTIKYETDIVAWANEQARLVRAGQFKSLDFNRTPPQIYPSG